MTSINEPSQSAPPTDHRWTIQRLLDWTSDFFGEHDFDQPRLDAEVLLAEALGCQRIDLYTRFNEEPDESTRRRFRDWVARHAQGEPVAYLVGHREFFSLKFQVTPDVLIPRPETEHLVTAALDYIAARQKQSPGDRPAVIDIGTGSGNIIVAIARHAPAAALTATDISAAALQVARGNAAGHDVAGKIEFVQSDLLNDVQQPALFDLIVSNPPYIGTLEKDTVQRSVAEYEPAGALFAGPDGCEVIERLIDSAAKRLKPGGRLLFEMSPVIVDRCCKLLAARGPWSPPEIIRDLAGLPRVVGTDWRGAAPAP